MSICPTKNVSRLYWESIRGAPNHYSSHNSSLKRRTENHSVCPGVGQLNAISFSPSALDTYSDGYI